MRTKDNPLVKIQLPDGTVATMFKKEAIRAGLLNEYDKSEIETKVVKRRKTKSKVDED